MGNGSQDVQNRLDSGSGHGWSGGQIMFWNCTAGEMIVQDPPGDQRNWAIGCKSTTITNVGGWTTESLGTIESQGTFITAIPSLFQAQLNERLSNSLSVKEVKVEIEKVEKEILLLYKPEIDKFRKLIQTFLCEQKTENFRLLKEIKQLETDKYEIQEEISYNLEKLTRIEKSIGVKCNVFSNQFDKTVKGKEKN